MKNSYNLNRVLLNPFGVYIIWSAFLLYPVVCFVRFRLLSFYTEYSLANSYLWKIFIYSPYVCAIFFAFLILYWVVKKRSESCSSGQNRALQYVFISSLVMMFIGKVLLHLELINYANYLYSRYGIETKMLGFVVTICWLTDLLLIPIVTFGKSSRTIFVRIKSRFIPLESRASLLANVFVLACIVYTSLSLYTLANMDIYWKTTTASFDLKYGDQFKYIEMLRENTPEDSIIVHPKRDKKWPSVGNQAVMRYFLFPRQLVDGKLINSQNYVSDFKGLYFIEIDKNIPDTHWPEIMTESKEIVFDGETKIRYAKLEILKEVGGTNIYKVIF